MTKQRAAIKYTYEINPRAAELGGGWKLRLLEDGEEMGGGVFPSSTDEAESREAFAAAQAEADDWLVSRPKSGHVRSDRKSSM
jgi:hypothetical protein